MGGFALNFGQAPSLFSGASSALDPISYSNPNFASTFDPSALSSFGVQPINFGAAGSGSGLSTPSVAAASPFKFGMNLPSLQVGLSGLQTLSNLWNAFQQTSIARDQLNYTKEIGNANLTNQIKSYNTNLTDRANSRGVMEGLTPAQTQAYINANQLNNPIKG